MAAVVVTFTATLLFPGALPVGVVLQGALLGSLTGLLALGLVLIYRTTRVVNFAFGAMGGLPAAAAATMYLGHGWPWPLAIASTVALGAAVGAGTERLVIRRFADAPRLVLTVASIGLAQILGGIELFEPRWLHGPTFITSFDTGLSRLHATVGPVLFTGNDLVLVAVVPAVIAALSWFLLRTDTGVAVRAIAENTDRARLLGVPAGRLSLMVWALAGGVAGLAVLLQAPSQGIPLDAAAGPAILLAPLAAAVVARFESLGVAFATGVALGVIDQVVRWNVAKQSVETVVFLAVILVALASQQRRSRLGDAPDESSWSASGLLHSIPRHLSSLPEVRMARRAVGAAVAAAVIVVPLLASPSLLDRISVALIFGLAALSLVVLSGWGGAVSLGQMALVGVGGVVAGDLMVHLNLDLFLAIVVAAVASGLVALVVGLPALRVRGLYLAVTTLAFAVAVDSFFFNPANFSSALPHGVARPVLWKRFDLHSERALYFVCLGALAFAVICARGIRQARPGRVLLAARDNWRAAEAAAVPTTRVRLSAFVLSGMIAGVAGALYVVLLGTVGYHTFPPPDSILVFSMAVIGGLGSISGALCGVALIQLAGVVVPRLQLILTGTGLLVVLMVFPAGIAGALERVRDAALNVVARRRGLARTAWDEAGDDAGAVAVPSRAVSGSAPSGILACAEINASYGPLQVLFGVDLDVGEGEILALLGTNGAGKSTLLKTVTGLLASSGDIQFSGQRLSGRSPEQIAALGVTLMPGGRGVFPTLSVEENLRVASWLIRHDRTAVATAKDRVTAMFPILRSRWATKAGNLSGGEQQMLSLAMAFLVRPRLLCIDELSLGLAPAVV
ncbi:MAG TPA: ATP-binding cassette domain-containing protein, partial [Acidimicrobiales bacterium]|nr:ATP-binding cassette domain-containing protein [Acidimicrobiales bacterium]